MYLAEMTAGAQLLVAEVPVATSVAAAIIGTLLGRWAKRHDKAVKAIADDVKAVKRTTEAHTVDLALLMAGDTEDDEEIKRTRLRLHRLENAATFVRARLEMRGQIAPGEWDQMQRENA